MFLWHFYCVYFPVHFTPLSVLLCVIACRKFLWNVSNLLVGWHNETSTYEYTPSILLYIQDNYMKYCTHMKHLVAVFTFLLNRENKHWPKLNSIDLATFSHFVNCYLPRENVETMRKGPNLKRRGKTRLLQYAKYNMRPNQANNVLSRAHFLSLSLVLHVRSLLVCICFRFLACSLIKTLAPFLHISKMTA